MERSTPDSIVTDDFVASPRVPDGLMVTVLPVKMICDVSQMSISVVGAVADKKAMTPVPGKTFLSKVIEMSA